MILFLIFYRLRNIKKVIAIRIHFLIEYEFLTIIKVCCTNRPMKSLDISQTRTKCILNGYNTYLHWLKYFLKPITTYYIKIVIFLDDVAPEKVGILLVPIMLINSFN